VTESSKPIDEQVVSQGTSSKDAPSVAASSVNGSGGVSGGEMTAAELAETKEYGHRSLLCDLFGQGLDLVFIAVMVFVVAVPGGWLTTKIEAITEVATLRLLILAGVLVLANMVVSFPLAFYSGFILEHRYGLSRQSFFAWLWSHTKWKLLEIGFSAVMIPGLYWIIWLTGSWWWIVGAVAFFLFSAVLGQLFPKVIMPMFHKVEPLDSEESHSADLLARMKRLAEGTGLSIEGVYRLGMSEETVKANAMLAGLGRTRRVVLGDNLIDGFSPDEVEVIIAHEVGHHVFRHIKKIIVGTFFASLAAFWLCDQLVGRWLATTDASWNSEQGFPYYTLPMMMLILSVAGLLMGPVHCAISRRFERQCDRYALERTGLRDAYRSAFLKLAKLNKGDPDPHPLEVLLLHDHPPISERIAAADQL